MSPLRLQRDVARLRKLLEQERGRTRAAREELQASHARERALRAEVGRLMRHERDSGTTDAPPRRLGYRMVDAQFRDRVTTLKAEGRNNSQISRLLGCSVATVSLLVRGKYPTEIGKNPG